MTARHLYAIHDFSPDWAALIRDAGVTGWSVVSEEIGDDPQEMLGADYTHMAAYGVTPIVRLNYSHHGKGTVPLPNRYEQFALRCANFVAGSRGCRHWIVANEPNLRGERVNDIPIMPAQYAECFAKARRAIKQRGAQHLCIVAAIAPYNMDTGPWMQYWADMLWEIEQRGGADGLALHFYGRGSSPAAITSEAKMESFPQYYNGFRAYRDQLSPAVVPESLRGLPAYGTETNQIDPWVDANTGWVQAAYAEINEWNNTPGTQEILCLDLYRWEPFDKWHIKGRQGVIDDFRAAVAQRYESPPKDDEKLTTYLPSISTGGDNRATPLVDRDWDDRLTARGVTIETPPLAPGDAYWRVAKARWFDERESQGRHHIYIETITQDGRVVAGVPFEVMWPNGRKTEHTKAGKGFEAGNYPMSPSLNEFLVHVSDGTPSETVRGIGMGTDGNPGIHTSTLLTYQLATVPSRQPAQPQVGEGPVPHPEGSRPQLSHPLANPAQRIISQHFGENPQDYAQFGMAGHTGVDYAVPVGTPVGAVDSGVVMESGTLPDYGEYVKLRHLWGESLYAHLSARKVEAGEPVNRGTVIGRSGNTGNSTGAHLHLGIRVFPYRRGAPYDGFSDPLPYLNANAPFSPQPATPTNAQILSLIKTTAQEFGLDWQMLASLAWAESSWRPDARSSAGAMGLTQMMPATWQEWAARVGASDPFDAKDNLRAGAAYLAYLLRTTDNIYQALHAYVWGIGRVLQNEVPPDEVVAYAAKIVHGRDLLVAVGA